MDAKRFRSRALHEGERYGQDPFVFLRELAQNSRDAGADRIDIEFEAVGDRWRLCFRDDGAGMSFEEAKRYLFRLYASSKEGTAETAGRFGVGFWSILRFEPSEFRVESGTADDRWAVRCSGDLSSVEPVEVAERDRTGTVVELYRARRAEEHELVANVGEKLRHYCRYLCRAGRSRHPLPVFFNGHPINEAMTLDGPFTLSFSTRDAQGVVGLGREPRVELYARGLWVSTVSVLEELDPDANQRRPAAPGEGLAPVVVLNSDTLDVVLSRDEPVDSRALRRLLKLARARVDRLVEHAIDGVAPRSFWTRVGDAIQGAVRGLGGATMASILVVWFLVLSAILMFFVHSRAHNTFAFAAGVEPAPVVASAGVQPEQLAQAPSVAPSLGQPYRPITGYRGATIDVPTEAGNEWSLNVNSEKPLYFRALSLDAYDGKNGWRQAQSRSMKLHPDFSCDSECLDVQMAVGSVSGRLVIPVPTGYGVDPKSVDWNGEPVEEVWLDTAGEASVVLHASGMHVLSYKIGKAKVAALEEFPAPKNAPLNPYWNSVLKRASRSQKKRAVQLVTRRVRNVLEYDVSARTAARFERSPGLWSERVIATQAGDCDVKNGLNVILLRRLGIPSRLAVGMVSIGGRARSGLHAWTEYHHAGRWHVADATGRPAPAPVRRANPQRVRRLAVSGPAPETTAAVDGPRPPRPLQPQERPSPVVLAPETGREAWPDVPIVATLRRDTVFAAFLLLCVLGLCLGALWFYRRRRVAETIESRGAGDEQREAVAGMVRELMRGGSGWRGIASLGRRRVLPTLGGSHMSLVEALERSRKGQLWAGNRRSPLARAASARGHLVLDLDDTHFGALVRQSFDVIDLAELQSLNVSPLPAALGRVLSPLLQRHGRVSCAWSSRLGDRPMAEFDLTPLGLGSALDFPARCVVVNPEHPEIHALIEESGSDPHRGGFLWVDWLVSHSVICERHSASLREAAAQALFEDVAA